MAGNDSNTFELSRRKSLAAIGIVGAASAGAGLGTSAYFNDSESFGNNTVQAGELNLIVDWYTDYDQGSAGSGASSGTVDGEPAEGEDDYVYTVTDVKPGDSGTLAFCPKVVDNPAWLWIGSETGVTDYENGQTEPEAEVDGTAGDPGEGNGELSENIQITSVSYASGVSLDGDEVVCDVIGEMDNPDDYTLADLASELGNGFLIDGDLDTSGTQAYPASPDGGTQNGPCICIEWEVPTDVENVIQTDSVDFGFSFTAVQERHNPGGNSSSPYNTTSGS